ncbi:MAG: hypothetical protein JW882_07105 [Deltaproteobacteria bacterium]|nr:hypothetical protein [Deltaproteobacteria bacterium]
MKRTKASKTTAATKTVIIIGIAIFHLFQMLSLSWSDEENRKEYLNVTMDRDSAPVGSIVELYLDYRLPEGGQITEPAEITGIDGLSILERETGRNKITIKILIDRLDPWKSEKISLHYLDREGKEAVLEYGPVSITVMSNLGDQPNEASLRPIRDIIPVKNPLMKYLPWAAMILSVSVIAFSLFIWLKRRNKNLDDIAQMAPPHIRAEMEIRSLESSGLFEKGAVKEYYFRFSEILRHYLEAIRHFPAAEFTTEEITQYVREKEDRNLINLFRRADLVKFADAVPTSAGKAGDLSNALSYISDTAPRVENNRNPRGKGKESQP